MVLHISYFTLYTLRHAGATGRWVRGGSADDRRRGAGGVRAHSGEGKLSGPYTLRTLHFTTFSVGFTASRTYTLHFTDLILYSEEGEVLSRRRDCVTPHHLPKLSLLSGGHLDTSRTGILSYKV